MDNSRKGILFAFAALLFLSFLPIITNGRPTSVSALDFSLYFTFWEMAIATPLFLREASSKRGLFDPAVAVPDIRRAVAIIVGTGGIFTVTTVLYVVVLREAGTVNTAIAVQTMLLFTLVIELVVLRLTKSWKELFFSFTLILGLFYLGTSGTFVLSNFSIWFGIALVVPFLWSIANIIIRRTLTSLSISPNQVLFIRVVVTTSVLFGISTVVNGPAYVVSSLFNPEIQQFAFPMGLCYYFELLFWYYSLNHIDASVTTAISMPAPVLTGVLGVFILGEAISSIQVVSMVITIISLYGILLSSKSGEEVSGVVEL